MPVQAWKLLVITLFLTILLNSSLHVQASREITAEYLVRYKSYTYYKLMVTVDPDSQSVVRVKLTPDNKTILDQILIPSPNHFYIGPRGVKELAENGVLKVEYGKLILRKMVGTPGKGWLILDTVEARLSFIHGDKLVRYDVETGLLVLEAFTIGPRETFIVELLDASLNIYVENPAPPQCMVVLYAVSGLLILGAAYTIMFRHKYVVI